MHNSLSESLIPINSEKIQPLKKSSQTLTSTINTNKILFTPEMDNEKKNVADVFLPYTGWDARLVLGEASVRITA